MILKDLLIIIVLIVLPLESYALSPSYYFRHIYEQTNDSSSPSPSHGFNPLSDGSNFLSSCNGASRSCRLKNIAACLTYSQSGSHEETCLLVQNNGENPLHLNIIILPANNTIKQMDLQSHQMDKINISSYINLSSTIALNTSEGDCVIHAAAPPPENHYQKKSSLHTYITPINGAYISILLFIIVGGSLTCFKLRMHGRHLNGVPYHELEMGNSKALSSNDLEDSETENWDQDWDDDWGDEKPAKSGGKNPARDKQANGLTTKLPNSNGKKKEWDD